MSEGGPDKVDKPLSPREEQIVHLAVEGYTNEGIAAELALSLSTVNTYWLRIRMKVHGTSRTAVVARLIREQADAAATAATIGRAALAEAIATSQTLALELRSALALLQLTLDQLGSAVWSTGPDLKVGILAKGENRHFQSNLALEVGHTIHQVFSAASDAHPAVAVHLAALGGAQGETRVEVEGTELSLFVRPMLDDKESVVGCIGVITSLLRM